MQVRPYTSNDYPEIVKLYNISASYGGQFDEKRDSKEKLQKRIENDPDAILIAEQDGKVAGTLSLIEDGRTAWLFRFCVVEIENKDEIAKALFNKAKEVLKQKNHQIVLVYTPVENSTLYERYEKLGFTKGNDYTCYWKDI